VGAVGGARASASAGAKGGVDEQHPGRDPAADEAADDLPDGDHLVPGEGFFLIVAEPGVDVAARQQVPPLLAALAAEGPVPRRPGGVVPVPARPPRLGAGFGISQATACRHEDEAVQVLAARAPSLREALDKAAEQGLPYLILDGILISSDRCADKKTSRKGKEIDKWYSGKAHKPAGNVQAPGRARRRATGPARRWLSARRTGTHLPACEDRRAPW
jgi:hypothetical protein